MNKKYTNKKTFSPNQRDDDCEDCMDLGSDLLGFSVESTSFYNFTVHINTDVREARYYSKVFDMMLRAGESDCVNFFIASDGGDLDGLNILLEGIRLTEAETCAILVGPAHSAASILALNCGSVVVTDSASMLCHNMRTGYGGKMADLDAFTTHSKRIADKLMHETYKGFLSDESIQEVIHGKELWLTADQIRERLAQRDDYLEAKFLAEQEEMKALQEQDVPKPKRKKKK